MRDVTFRIEGLSPLLMNNGDQVVKYAKQTMTVFKKLSAKKQAERGLYRLDNGDLYLPTIAFIKSMLRASAGITLGKYAAKTILMGAVLAIEQETVLLDPKTGRPIRTWKIDTRRVVIKGSGAIPKSRPQIDCWSCELKLRIDDHVITDSEPLLGLFNKAGRVVGVGDYRMECGGQFGRFSASIIDGEFCLEEEETKTKKKAG